MADKNGQWLSFREQKWLSSGKRRGRVALAATLPVTPVLAAARSWRRRPPPASDGCYPDLVVPDSGDFVLPEGSASARDKEKLHFPGDQLAVETRTMEVPSGVEVLEATLKVAILEADRDRPEAWISWEEAKAEIARVEARTSASESCGFDARNPSTMRT